MPDLDWTIFILYNHSILFSVFGDASLDSLDNLETLGVNHHQIFRVLEVEQLVPFHHRVIIAFNLCVNVVSIHCQYLRHQHNWCTILLNFRIGPFWRPVIRVVFPIEKTASEDGCIGMRKAILTQFDQFWTHSGPIVDPFWTHCGPIVDPFQTHFGPISVPNLPQICPFSDLIDYEVSWSSEQ